MAPSYYFSNLQKIFSFFILELWADYKAGFIEMKPIFEIKISVLLVIYFISRIQTFRISI